MPCCRRMLQSTLRVSIATRVAAIHGNGRNFCVGGLGVITQDGHVLSSWHASKYLGNLDRGKSCGHLNEWGKLLRRRSESDSARHACSLGANMLCCRRTQQNTLRISIATRVAAIHGNGRNFCVGGLGVITQDGHVCRCSYNLSSWHASKYLENVDRGKSCGHLNE